MIPILQVIDTHRIGGPGKTILNSARFIDPAEFRVHVAAVGKDRTGSSEFLDAADRAGVPRLVLPDRQGISAAQIRTLRGYIRDHGIRILVTRGYKPNLMGLYLAKTSRSLVLVSTHHGWVANNIRQRAYQRLDRALARFFDGIICVAEDLLAFVPPKMTRDGRAIVIRNAIVLEDYRPSGRRREFRERIGVRDGEFLIGVVGRMSEEKGVLEMLDAFERLQAGNDAARLLFIGEGPLQRTLTEAIERRGLTERVRVLPHQTPVQPWFEAMDALASPSRSEGLSNVILEGMAFELPVVATRVGGNGEIIDSGRNGMLVPPGEPTALAEALAVVSRNAETARRIGRAGLETVRRDFDFRARMGREEAFYRMLLERRAARPDPST